MKNNKTNYYRGILLLTVFLSFSISIFSQNVVPAFPTAEGYGKWASGGRGGKVVVVTNLLDDGVGEIAGSLRWALKQYPGEPITVVFETSGIIDLQGKDLRNKRNNITIAGQTAPGDGICIKGGSVNFGGSRNLIIRHIRFRVGLLGNENAFIPGACLNIENGGNFIVDHCSFSWSAEENVGFYDNDNTTVQWCIMAEGLYDAGHGKGARGYGAVLGGKTATYHHNLIAHNANRAPRFGATTPNDRIMLLDYVNNVHYNWGKKTACYGGDNRQGVRGEFKINYVNNYSKPGPAYPGTSKSVFIRASYYSSGQGGANGKWHLDGNYMEGTANTSLNENNYSGLEISEYTEKNLELTINDMKSDHLDVPYPVTTEMPQEAYKSVLQKAGALPLDGVDNRIIEETKNGTAVSASSFNAYRVTGIVDKPEDSGGYPNYKSYNFILDSDKDGIPDFWEKANGMNPFDAEDRNLLSSEGYTYLEVYLNGLTGEYLNNFNYPDPIYIPTNINTFKTVQKALTVYPEKSGNMLFVKSDELIKEVILFDSVGNKVFEVSGNDISEIKISSLPKGIYISLFKMEDNKIERIKFIKR